MTKEKKSKSGKGESGKKKEKKGKKEKEKEEEFVGERRKSKEKEKEKEEIESDEENGKMDDKKKKRLKKNGKKETKEGEKVGSYNLGKKVGVVCFGDVFIGIHENSLDRVGIKVIDRAVLEEKEILERIEREKALLKLLCHPNVTPLHSCLIEDSHLFQIIEFCRHQEVAKVAKDLPSARTLFRYLIDFVSYLHNLSLCHRDIRIDNLFSTDSGVLKICDLSFASHENSKDIPSFLREKFVQFRAPELFVDEKECDGKALDLWGCGVCLFVWVTGSFPFQDPDKRKCVEMILKGDFQLPESVPKDLVDLIEKLLTVDPLKRANVSDAVNHVWCVGDDKWAPHQIEENIDVTTSIEEGKVSEVHLDELMKFGLAEKEARERLTTEGSDFLKAYYRHLENPPPELEVRPPAHRPTKSFKEIAQGRTFTPKKNRTHSQFVALDAGSRYKSTTDMLSSFGRRKPFSSSRQGSATPIQRSSRVVSIYQRGDSLLSPTARSPAKSRPLSFRERSSEIRELCLHSQEEGLALPEDFESTMPTSHSSTSFRRGSPFSSASPPNASLRASRSGLSFSSADLRVHHVSVHARPPPEKKESQESPSALFERDVESEYIADESAMCLFELDVQRDIIVSEADEAVVLEPNLSPQEPGMEIDEDLDLGRPPTSISPHPSTSPIFTASPGKAKKGKKSKGKKK